MRRNHRGPGFSLRASCCLLGGLLGIFVLAVAPSVAVASDGLASTGLLPRLVAQEARPSPGPASLLGGRVLSPGRLSLKAGADEPDDLDLLPELVPLVDPEDPPETGEEDGGMSMSFDAIDLSDGDEGSASEAAVTPPEIQAGERRPLVAQWWFWTAIAVVVVGAGGAVAATSKPELVLPEGSLGTMDRR